MSKLITFTFSTPNKANSIPVKQRWGFFVYFVREYRRAEECCSHDLRTLLSGSDL